MGKIDSHLESIAKTEKIKKDQQVGSVESKEKKSTKDEIIRKIKAASSLDFPDKAFNQSVYDKLLPLTLLASKQEQTDKNKEEQMKQAIHDAVKLTVLFGNYDNAITYLKEFEASNPNSRQLIHDSCLISLPSGNDWEPSTWQGLTAKFIDKKDFQNILVSASKIHAYVNQDQNKKTLETKVEESFLRQFERDILTEFEKLVKQSEIKEEKTSTTQQKEIDDKFKDYLKTKLEFPARGKPNDTQLQDFKDRIKSPTDDDKAVLKKITDELLLSKKSINTTQQEYVAAKLKESKIKMDEQVRLAKINILSVNTDYIVLQEYASHASFTRAKERPDAAALFFELGISEESFNDYLELKPVDNKDKIPDVVIEGKDIGHDRFYLKKLDPKDPRAAVLGKLTSCCQSLGSQGEACARHGITDENGGFYVLCRMGESKPSDKDDIVAQCWAWRGEEDNLVFDSIESQVNFRESKKENNVEVINAFYAYLADQLVKKHNVPRVLVGTGGGTPELMKTLRVPFYMHETLVNYTGYRDSKKQAIIAYQGLTLLPLFAHETEVKEQKDHSIKNKIDEKKKMEWLWILGSFKEINNSLLNNFTLFGITNNTIKESLELSENLKSILKDGFQEEQKEKIIGLIEKGANPYFDIDFLLKILENTKVEKRVLFIKEILGIERIKKMVTGGFDLSMVLNMIPEINLMSYMQDTLGAEYIKKIVANDYHLSRVLDMIPETNRMSYMQDTLGVEYIKKIVRSGSDMAEVLDVIPTNRMSYMQDTLGVEYVKKMVKDRHDLVAILKLIPETERMSFMQNMLGEEHVKKMIEDSDDLTFILEQIPVINRMSFMKNTLGEEHVKNIVKSPNELTFILDMIPHPRSVSSSLDTQEMKYISLFGHGISMFQPSKTTTEEKKDVTSSANETPNTPRRR